MPRDPAHERHEAYRNIQHIDMPELCAWLRSFPAGATVDLSLDDVGVFHVDGSYTPPQPDARQLALDGAIAALGQAGKNTP